MNDDDIQNTTKNTGYVAAIIVLIAILIVSNVTQIIRYNDAEKQWEQEMSSWMRITADMRSNGFNLKDVDLFTKELENEYIYLVSIEPIGFINYSSENKDFGFRTILYNVTYNWIIKEQINGSVEVWIANDTTYTGYMTFDDAIGNNQEPMSERNIYRIFFIQNTHNFFNIIYYEKIKTRMD